MLSKPSPLFVQERFSAGFRSSTEVYRNGVICGWHKSVTVGEESLYQEFKMPTSQSGWLGAYTHDVPSELIVVHRGKIALAKLVGGKVSITTHKNGEVICTEALVPRNIFMYPGSTAMLVRYNDYQPADQHPCYDLDKLCVKIGLQEIDEWLKELQPTSV